MIVPTGVYLWMSIHVPCKYNICANMYVHLYIFLQCFLSEIDRVPVHVHVRGVCEREGEGEREYALYE